MGASMEVGITGQQLFQGYDEGSGYWAYRAVEPGQFSEGLPAGHYRMRLILAMAGLEWPEVYYVDVEEDGEVTIRETSEYFGLNPFEMLGEIQEAA